MQQKVVITLCTLEFVERPNQQNYKLQLIDLEKVRRQFTPHRQQFSEPPSDCPAFSI